MIFSVKLDEVVSVQMQVADLDELQLFFLTPQFLRFAVTPMSFVSYLELNEPEFMSYALDYAVDDDLEKYRKNFESFELNLDMFVNYIAHVFGVHKSQVSFSR